MATLPQSQPILQSISWGVPSNAVSMNGAYYLNGGDRVTITYTFNQPVTLDTNDYINLDNTGAATYSSGNGTKVITFLYTVPQSNHLQDIGSLFLSDTTIHDPSSTTVPSIDYDGLGTSFPKKIDVVDTTAPTISINPVAGDDILTAKEAKHGLTISGTATGAEDGQPVTIKIFSTSTGTPVLVDTVVTKVVAGSWDVQLTPAQALTFSDPAYKITADVSDIAGNAASESVQNFTSTICFMPGTMIRTPDGSVAVETLKVGDLVMAMDGRALPVVWLGRQTVSTVFADKLRVLPIRIKAGAFGENVPSRDLLVSPDHALLVDSALINAGALVNGSSIIRETNVPRTFTYYHVEVDDHSLILAENTPAETFVDNVDRLAFDNWAEHEAMYPDGKSITELPYPRAKAHRQVPVAIRVKLAERAHAIGAATDDVQVA